MAENILRSTNERKEQLFWLASRLKRTFHLVIVRFTEELALLADTTGFEVVGETSQKLERPHASTYIGSGKVEEVAALAEKRWQISSFLITNYHPPSARAQPPFWKISAHYRSDDAHSGHFAQHATTKEGRLQVELAQHEYRLPRLSHAWSHLERQAGGASGRSGSAGGVGLRGPGETQLEVDKREIRKRIAFLKKEIEKVSDHRKRYRAQRKRSQIPVVALVGYTNSGKSTLLNSLADADVYVADQLFATLDPTTRRVMLPGSHLCLFTDTVGFIQKLPTQLIAAFRSTLEEINEADLLLHVIDVSHFNAAAQYESVQATLAEIEADHIPVISVFNKADLLEVAEEAKQLLAETDPDAFLISAKTGQGMEALKAGIMEQLYEKMLPIRVRLPFTEGALIAQFHEQGSIDLIENFQNGVMMGFHSGQIDYRFQVHR